MDTTELKRKSIEQNQILRNLLYQIRRKRFVYWGRDSHQRLRAKLYFIRYLKHQLRKAFCFNDYQAEFVVNEAISKVLLPSNESLLVFYDTKKTEKLTKASFVLGHHYFRFIKTML